jgi:hypothetical protein
VRSRPFFMPAKEVNGLVLWTLVTVGYVAPALVGGIGLGHTGDVATRLGRAAGRTT